MLRKLGKYGEAADICEDIAATAVGSERGRTQCYAHVEAGICHLLDANLDAALNQLEFARKIWKSDSKRTKADRESWRIRPGDSLQDLSALQSHVIAMAEQLAWKKMKLDPAKHIVEMKLLMATAWKGLVLRCGVRHAGLLRRYDPEEAERWLNRAEDACYGLVGPNERKQSERYHDLEYTLGLINLARGRPAEAARHYGLAVAACCAKGVVKFATLELDLFFLRDSAPEGLDECREILHHAASSSGK